MNPAEWYDVCAVICDRWPEHAAQRGSKWADAWWSDVEMFEQDTLFAAIRAFGVEDSRGFPPDGGQLVRRAAALEGGGLDFDEVWREILDGIRRWGHAGSPEWSSPNVAALVQAVGWRALCLGPEDDLPTIRAQARDMWASISKRVVRSMLGIERTSRPRLVIVGRAEMPDLGS